MTSARSPVDVLTLEHADDEPIVFYGPPGTLRGGLRLRNNSDEKVKMPALALDVPGIKGPARQPLRHLSVLARIYPQQQAHVTAVMSLDPFTPPGTYEGSLGIADRWQRVRVHVTEQVDLRVEPTRVSLFTQGELAFRRVFVVENAGNVPLRLGSECIVPLGDTAELRAALQQGLRGACDAEGANDVLKAVLCALSERQVGTVSVKREDITLKPGETRPLAVTFTLPDDLRRFRRYVAVLPLYTSSVYLEVVTGSLETGPRSDQRSRR